ncbi:MAG: hypothetical protein GX885_11750 [Methanomicrobiales archaeon]|nr:hypothetical protein [Methanomicrobiales archaeon]
MVAEFKYNRKASNRRKKPRSQQAGLIFADIERLARRVGGMLDAQAELYYDQEMEPLASS